MKIIVFVWIKSSYELACDVTKNQAFSGKQERWVVEFASQSRALLMWRDLFVSAGATVYLTVPLLYPIHVELRGAVAATANA